MKFVRFIKKVYYMLLAKYRLPQLDWKYCWEHGMLICFWFNKKTKKKVFLIIQEIVRKFDKV